MNIVFNSEDEAIEDYLKEYNVSKNELDTYYHNQDKKKLFCIRIKETKGMDTFRTYTVTKVGKYRLY